MSCEDLIGYVVGPAGEVPPNYDGLPDTNFRLIFEKANIATFFLQEFNLAPIKVQEVKWNTPFVDPNEIGEKIIYDPFNITFLVDTKLRNFNQVFSWMKRMTVAGTKIDDTDTVTLMINGVQMIRFLGVWPMTLSGMNFRTNADKVTYITANLVLNYDYFEMINLI